MATRLSPADHAALVALEAALTGARQADDRRPPFVIVAGAFSELGVTAPRPRPTPELIARARDDWLRRLRSSERSESAVRAYRVAIGDLLAWAEQDDRGAELFEERTIVDYLDDYRRRANPAAATYHRHFLLLRRFMRWLSRRDGVPDPFLDLEPPPRPRQEREWLTPEEFQRLLVAAARRLVSRLPGLAERDRLVVLALGLTGLRRSELVALDWRDLSLDTSKPSLLVRRGKGGKPRRQPLAPQLADELRQLNEEIRPSPEDPVFCGLAGRRLQETTLAHIISRSAERAGLEKHVTAHTLRHTAATWLRQATGDARLVAEYLGHADLSTVSRYAHVASDELHDAATRLDECVALSPERQAIRPVAHVSPGSGSPAPADRHRCEPSCGPRKRAPIHRSEAA
jgi:site-specific recombinase XerD